MVAERSQAIKAIVSRFFSRHPSHLASESQASFCFVLMCSMSFFLNISFANEGSAKQIGRFLSNRHMIIGGRNRPGRAVVHLFEVGRHISSSRDSSSVFRFMKTMIVRRTTLWPLIASLAVLAVGLLWAFWPILVAMAERWSNDPRVEATPVLVGISTSGHWSANRLPRPLPNLPRASRGR